MKETNKRQDETDSRVEDNRRNIEDLRNLVEATRRELREQTAMSEGLAGRMQRIMEEELREREARRRRRKITVGGFLGEYEKKIFFFFSVF